MSLYSKILIRLCTTGWHNLSSCALVMTQLSGMMMEISSFRAGQSGGYCDLTTSMTQEQRRRGCITSHQSSRRCAEDINVSCFRAPSQQNTHFCCRAEWQVCFLMPCVNFGLGVLFISGSRLVCGSVHITIPVIPRIFDKGQGKRVLYCPSIFCFRLSYTQGHMWRWSL